MRTCFPRTQEGTATYPSGLHGYEALIVEEDTEMEANLARLEAKQLRNLFPIPE